MNTPKPTPAGEPIVITPDLLFKLLQNLARSGYRLIGPTVRDSAIVLEEIEGGDDLPIGWTDQQEAGTYRLSQRADGALFGYNVGSDSFKKFLYPPQQILWQAKRGGSGFEFQPFEDKPSKFAFIGVRPCELSAIAIQDRILAHDEFCDEFYKRRRQDTFILTVNCTQAGSTCFCASMNTGPRATGGYDLAATEIIDDSRHFFVVEIGSELGRSIISKIDHEPASTEILALVQQILSRAAERMGRSLDTDGLRELLFRNVDNIAWDQVGRRCLTCANCTLVCPTCFCSTLEDTTDLTGNHAERMRRWDSCFTMDFSYLHGGSVRFSPKSRYRQWLTHKLAGWHDQFGSSGCVGCGRCITWCPVGIDITEEARA
ncbi:MAG: 4Fe-4S dicluster domain-containing protein, partial [Candidatus Zixiibacteriota bacterium]